MTAPAGVVDLSLPDYRTLIARAGVDPDAEASRVAGASPGTVSGAGAAFAGAGGEMDAAWTQSMTAADTLGRAFTNNGAPVLDRGTHVGNLPAEFGDAGTRLAGASRRLGAVADELTATMTQTAAAVSGLHGELTGIRNRWAQTVAAAGTADGLIPQEAIPGLLAERDRIATQMTGRVSAVGQQVVQRIRGYEVVINDAVRLLADQGFVPPADLDLPPPPPPTPAYEGGADPTGFGTPLMAGYAADPVNTALGNFVEVETDLPFSGLLAGLTFARTYNSRSDVIGPFGARWSAPATVRLVEHSWTADYEGPDGQRVRFPRTGPDAFGSAIGIHALVERRESGLTLAWFDGRRWDFDAGGRLERTWAGPGTAVAFVHDEGGRLVELAHERGRRVLLDWSVEHDRIVALSSSDGRRVDYTYDPAGQLVEAAGPAGPRRYGIDDVGRVQSVTDADGVVELVNTYDRDGRVLTQRSPFGRVVRFDYAPDGVTVVADDSAGPRNTYRHDHAGRLLAATDGHGHTQHKRYDAAGNPIEIVERGGAVTRQEFDHRAHLVRRATPSGAMYEISWDDADRVTAIITSGQQTATATVRYTYTGAERIPSEITDPEGGVTRYAVTGGLVTAVTDADGVTVRLRHDADGNLIEARDAAGGVARVERDAAGLPTAVITPAGRRTELRHDAAGRLVERRDPAGGIWRHEYSAAGRRTATVDPTGARTGTCYGPHGEAVELVDVLGAVSTRRYDSFGNLAGASAPDGAKWTHTYDALSRLTAWTDPAGGSWLREHDADGHISAAIDPTGVRQTFTHDVAGRLIGVDDGLVVDEFGYDELGRPTEHRRADGSVRRAVHDRCGRQIRVTGADGGTFCYDYTPAGRLQQVQSPGGRVERYRYDACGRLVTHVDGNGGHWRLRYDADGLVTEKITPAGLSEAIERDPAGRVTRHRVPGRGTTGYTYDPAGRVVTVTDRHGRREFTHDPAGRLVAATDALGHTTRYTWDECGRLTAITDPLGVVTERGYDEVGRLTRETDPLGRTTRYRYDAAGRPVEQQDPTGAAIRWSYDTSGRLAAASAGARGPTIRIERDPLGRAVAVSETGAPTVELHYDPAGRPTERRRADRAVGWSYDTDGLRAGLTYPDGTQVRYRRDPAGRVIALEHPLLGSITVDRDPDGRVVSIGGAGAAAHFGYTDGWLTEHRSGAGDEVRQTRLTRDEQGRVLVADTDGRRRLFGYDTAGQLTSASWAGGEHRYGYDPAGRLTIEHASDGIRSHQHDAAGQLQASSGPDGERRFEHDAAGRRVAESGPQRRREYRWDELGRLTEIRTTDTAGAGTEARRTGFRVDALGELAEVGGVPLSWDSTDPAVPLAALGDEMIIGHRGPWAVADTTTGCAQPLHPDWQHGIGADTDPWGRAGAEPALGFRGELGVDGLIWLRNRVYDPDTRAFLQVDPLSAVPATPYAGNPYHYAGNDPVNALDPLGLRPVTDADLAGQREEDGGGWGWLKDLGHGALDVVGLIPVVGEAADLVNAGWYALEGDYVMAGLSAAAAIPGLGYAATAGKLGVKGARVAGKVAGEAVEGVPDTVRVFRVESPANARLDIGPSGDVAVKGDNMLFLNFGDQPRAQQFLDQRLAQGHSETVIKSFDVPRSYADSVASRAVPESMARQPDASIIHVDTTKTPSSYGLRSSEFPELQRSIIPGSGR
ncbi:MAG TPA: DUF6531 domain-containing protein [Pseudonocardia sp.]|nr:DUF6531 domain-containing protein [Pseudonocardia sp.]